ncbi:hypothetical protein CLV62_12156 [Dysgonomonas alginatilytica]|uniref:Lipoprotein n=1 Tax=Dysgonomonas alginatilytica TaxID=1605892 RepID=A0A2V3PLR2_9BACT|nr:hypothetical protein [Dysgonomonas alginatilytica]PXV62233.1 hypothetical protein CLV62_12156 [Dysgonomonas alginatilytica]
MKRVLFVLTVFPLLLIGCDYTYDYNYEITNSTNKIITVKTVKNESSFTTITDSIFQIKPNETKIVRDDYGGICGRNFLPPSEYKMTDTIPLSYIKLDIYIEDILTSRSLRLFKYWSYRAEKRTGIYNLRITEDLLAK